jgi:mono/diheme cytochrome c family protein
MIRRPITFRLISQGALENTAEAHPMRHAPAVCAIASVLVSIVIGGVGLARADDDRAWKAPARAKHKANPVAPDGNSIAAGKRIYQKECLDCHGPAGKGDGQAAKDLREKPSDLSSLDPKEQTDGELFWKITVGNKPMPAYGKLLGEESRWHVINYLHTLSQKGAGK